MGSKGSRNLAISHQVHMEKYIPVGEYTLESGENDGWIFPYGNNGYACN